MTLAAVFLLGACASSAPETFDLVAASAPPSRQLGAQLSIGEPVASYELDSQRIVVRTAPESLAYLSGAQWSDRLPSLVQARLVQTFQNARLLQSVAPAGSGPAAEYSLELDIRAFELAAPERLANVEIAAKIIAARSGRVLAARVFKAQASATGTSGAEAAAALNAALASVMRQILAFTSAQI